VHVYETTRIIQSFPQSTDVRFDWYEAPTCAPLREELYMRSRTTCHVSPPSMSLARAHSQAPQSPKAGDRSAATQTIENLCTIGTRPLYHNA
jgi:hypothetical protein